MASFGRQAVPRLSVLLGRGQPRRDGARGRGARALPLQPDHPGELHQHHEPAGGEARGHLRGARRIPVHAPRGADGRERVHFLQVLEGPRQGPEVFLLQQSARDRGGVARGGGTLGEVPERHLADRLEGHRRPSDVALRSRHAEGRRDARADHLRRDGEAGGDPRRGRRAEGGAARLHHAVGRGVRLQPEGATRDPRRHDRGLRRQLRGMDMAAGLPPYAAPGPLPLRRLLPPRPHRFRSAPRLARAGREDVRHDAAGAREGGGDVRHLQRERHPRVHVRHRRDCQDALEPRRVRPRNMDEGVGRAALFRPAGRLAYRLQHVLPRACAPSDERTARLPGRAPQGSRQTHDQPDREDGGWQAEDRD